jgi:hypothetical protein
MECLQRNKNGKRCSKLGIETHRVHPGYCKFHITRFEANLDVPTPFTENNHNIPIPELPAGGPVLGFNANFNDMDFLRLIDHNIDMRLNMFIRQFYNEIIIHGNGRNPEELDMILFESIVTLPAEEQNFLIVNYERLIELVQIEIRRIDQARINGNPVQPVPVQPIQRVQIPADGMGIIQRILQAVGFREEVQEVPVHNQEQARQQPPQQDKELARFATDNQNVHTSKTVEMVLETSKKLMKMAKKKPSVLDTMAHCFTKCKLSDKARQQMAFMYYSEISIYNLKAPTYRFVMDGIWVYIDSQSEELQKEITGRLAQELEDNIGMCPQGNLSRLVNVLSGYMDGVGFKLEKTIQDLMLELRDIPDKKEREVKAIKLCKQFKQTSEETKAWIELLADI